MAHQMAYAAARRIFRRLLSAGISRTDANSIRCLSLRILTTRGIVGGHTYLKDVCSQLKSYLYGSNYTPNTWLKVDSDGFPSALRMLRSYPDSVLAVVTAMHKAVVFNEVTQSQRSKFLGSLTVEDVDPASLQSALQITERGRLRLAAIGSGDLSSRHTEFALLKAYRLFGSSDPEWTLSTCKSIISQYLSLPSRLKPLAKEALGPIYRYATMAQFPILHCIKPATVVGTIGITQEPGGKLRSFANPNVLFQSMLDPLKDYVTDVLHKTENDYTKSHENGAIRVQSLLRAGTTVYSLDSEDATNRAPWYLQRYLLERLNVPSEYIQLMDFIVTGNWDASKLGEETVSWKHGQPLGIGPSFALYALWHNCFLAGLSDMLNLKENCWAIIGDDLAIWNPDLADLYMRYLPTIGGKINMSKSVISNRVAEFAGYMITPEFMIRPGKFQGINVNDVSSLITNYPKIVNEIDSPDMRAKIKFYLSTFTNPDYAYLADEFMYLRLTKPCVIAGSKPVNSWYVKQMTTLSSGYCIEPGDVPDPTRLLRKVMTKLDSKLSVSVLGLYPSYLICHQLLTESDAYWYLFPEINNRKQALSLSRKIFDSIYVLPRKLASEAKSSLFDDWRKFVEESNLDFLQAVA